MTGSERRSVLSLAFLYLTRMLGLFMVLPVFMIYGQALEGANELLLGVAIGAYGLSQALFQVPFGALSDKYGRKKLILIGLFIFFIGSVVAASSEHIYGVIVGRFLQGSGAIASVLMALLSDLTSEESRTKAMALVGASIGASFSLALVLGPILVEWVGLHGIFWVTAGLALFAIGWLLVYVPSPVQSIASRDTRLFKDQLGAVFANKDLLRLDWGIFSLHLCITAIFIAVPRSLQNYASLALEHHWWVYLSVLLLSFIAMLPFIILGEKKRQMRKVFLSAVSLLALAAYSAGATQSNFTTFWFSLFLFFMAFNLLEACLPSLVSKLSPAGGKGTAMGVYSTSQFFGAFIGGVSGGWVLSIFGEAGVYSLVSLVCVVWLIVAWNMANPNPETAMTLYFAEGKGVDYSARISHELSLVRGVEEVVMVPEDHVAYLKVVKAQLDMLQLDSVRRRYSGENASTL
jgi:MFS family permease